MNSYRDKSTQIINSLILLLFFVFLIIAAQGDLWFDEVWSLFIAREAGSLVNLFKGAALCDNNHILNSAYLLLWDGDYPFIVYRIMAVVCGVGTFLILQDHSRRIWGGVASITTGILTAFSYMLVLYFSEARGYAPALFFSLLAFTTLMRSELRLSFRWINLFNLALVLCVLGHASAVAIIPALLVYSVMLLHKQRVPSRRAFTLLIMYYAPAGICLIGYAAIYLNRMSIGGGSILNHMGLAAWSQAMCILVGMPNGQVGFMAACIVSALVYLAGLYLLFRKNRPLFMFYTVLPVTISVMFLFQSKTSFVYPRYFIIGFPFFYLLAGLVVQSGFEKGGNVTKGVCIACLVLYVAGQMNRLIPQMVIGRGEYERAVAESVVYVGKKDIKVGGNIPFRTLLMFSFYSQRLECSPHWTFVPIYQWSDNPPDVLFINRFEAGLFDSPRIDFQDQANARIFSTICFSPNDPVKSFNLSGKIPYRLLNIYSYQSLSGWEWLVYVQNNIE